MEKETEGEVNMVEEDEVVEEKFTIKGAFSEAYDDLVNVIRTTDYKGSFLFWIMQPRLYMAVLTLFIVEISFGLAHVATEWHMIFLYGWIFISFTPINNNPGSFFKGKSMSNKEVGYFTLTTSAFIAWIFAKSITNSAGLGASFGFVGGVGYACYYLSFFVAAFVIYRVRVIYGFHSLALALEARYGKLAAIVFGLTVTIRLFNEVWSNAAVVGSYFGPVQSGMWWIACILASAIPVVYVMLGGVRTSIISDALQSLLSITLLIIILAVIVPEGNQLGTHFVNTGSWKMEHGVDFIVLALVQIWSYPFHDPVLTDHGFLTKPKVMVASFITAGTISGTIIALFSFVGIYGKLVGVGGDPPAVARHLNPAIFSVVALLMMSSSISVVDSTLSSTARLIGLQAAGYITKGTVLKPEETNQWNVLAGRVAMVVIAIVGTLPLLGTSNVLLATTVSGTMVIGLAPNFLLIGLTYWRGKDETHPLAFHMSFWAGVIIGIIQVANKLPSSWNIGKGTYANLLGANIYGSIICFGLFFIGLLIPGRWLAWPYEKYIRKYMPSYESRRQYVFEEDVDMEEKPKV